MTGPIKEEDMTRTHSPAELGRLASFPLMNPNPVLEVDFKGRVRFMNPVARRLFPELGSPGRQHPFLAGLASVVSACRASKDSTFTREVRVGRAWYEQLIYLVPDVRALRIYGHDITLRKQTEETLRQREIRHRTILHTAMDGFLLVDTQGRILEVNETYCRMSGYSEQELLALSLPDLEAAESDGDIAAHIETIMVQGDDRFESRHRRRDGSMYDVEVSVKYQPVDGGRFVSFLRDITERKRAEEDLIRAKEDLEVRVRERTQDLMTANAKLAAEIVERKGREHHIRATNDLLKLFTHTFLRRQYLDELTRLLQQWCPCSSAGIRLVDEQGGITDGVYEGFSLDFMKRENCLSAKKDCCICPRILAGKPEESDLPYMTPGGSFYCNDISRLAAVRKRQKSGLFRAVCLHHKHASLAVIPIRYRENMLGAIHLADTRKGHVPRSLIEFIESMAPLIGEALYRFSVEESLVISRQQLRELSGHLLAAREEERTKVAREIHDELGQILTAAMIELSGIRGKYKKQKPLVGRILSVSEMLDGAVRDIQRICSELRPRLLDHLGLLAAIEWEAGQFSKRSGIRCSLDLPPNHRKFPAPVATSLFRICQEALTNVSRHSGATEVAIRLAVEDGSAVLEIKDNGRGISKEKLAGKKSFGIMGIHERAYDLGGTVSIHGTRSKGTLITVVVPLTGTRGMHA